MFACVCVCVCVFVWGFESGGTQWNLALNRAEVCVCVRVCACVCSTEQSRGES